MEISSYKDNLRLWSARNMRASYRTGAPDMVIVMKEKFLCLISRVFCLVQRIKNLFIRLTRWHSTTGHNSLSLAAFTCCFEFIKLSCNFLLCDNKSKLSLSQHVQGKAKFLDCLSLLVVCTMLWCHVTEHSVSRLHSRTTMRGLSSDALCGELPPNIVTVRHSAERSA